MAINMNDALTDTLTSEEKRRILRNVILEVSPPPDESPAAREWREGLEKEKAKADAAGVMLDIPFDW